jgi:hypothetical protein
MGGKSMSDVNFDCYDDINKDEMERLQQTINDIESENSCNRLMITKLEDELIMIRKCESRNVSVLHSVANNEALHVENA